MTARSRVDSQRALSMLRDAYGELAVAEKGGVDPSLIAPLRARAVHGLDFLYSAHHAKATPCCASTVARSRPR